MIDVENREYDDTYPSCARTYATLRIFSDALTPEEITTTLAIQPTMAFRKGEPYSICKLHRKANGWFYTTEGLSNSKDFRRHLDLILDALDGKIEAVKTLHSKDCDIDITSFYESYDQGGPWLMPYQMLKLGAFGISIWWDLYFVSEEEEK